MTFNKTQGSCLLLLNKSFPWNSRNTLTQLQQILSSIITGHYPIQSHLIPNFSVAPLREGGPKIHMVNIFKTVADLQTKKLSM